jgi:hypothetical protein
LVSDAWIEDEVRKWCPLSATIFSRALVKTVRAHFKKFQNQNHPTTNDKKLRPGLIGGEAKLRHLRAK